MKRADISSLFCPVGGAEVMKTVAAYLGKAAPEKEPQVATVRCGGSCEKRPRINAYDGVTSCAVAASLYGGETGCTYGCLGYGDCVTVCNFDAIAINPRNEASRGRFRQMYACGACVKACPKSIIELRKKWPKQRAVYVSCVSKRQRGGGDESLQSRLYRLRKMRESVSVRSHYDPEQPGFHRLLEMQALPQVRERNAPPVHPSGRMEPLPKEPKAAPASKQTSQRERSRLRRRRRPKKPNPDPNDKTENKRYEDISERRSTSVG